MRARIQEKPHWRRIGSIGATDVELKMTIADI
jgi:hypothetical protein